MDSLISGNGFPSSLGRHGYRTILPFIDDEPETRYGYTQRSLEPVEVPDQNKNILKRTMTANTSEVLPGGGNQKNSITI